MNTETGNLNSIKNCEILRSNFNQGKYLVHRKLQNVAEKI